MAMAGRVWHVAGPAPGVPDVLVTDRRAALAWPAQHARRLVVLTEGVGAMVPAVRERIREQGQRPGHSLVVRDGGRSRAAGGGMCAEVLHGRRPGDAHGVTLEVADGAGRPGPW